MLIDLRHRAELDIVRLARQCGDLRQTLHQRVAQIPPGKRLAILQQAHQIAVGGTVAVPLQHDQIARRRLPAHVVSQQRAEILPAGFAVADLNQITGKGRCIASRHGDTRRLQLAAGNALLLVQLADHGNRAGGALV